MKKILSIILVTVLVLAMCVPFAVSAEPKSLNIPKAATVPTLDGVINADEWKGSLAVEMKAGDDSISVPAGDADGFKGASFQFMWADEGIYFSAVSNGNNDPFGVPEADNGSYNTGNGVQFNMFPTRDSAGAVGETFFFSYHPKADDGKPYVGEHFVYGTGGSGENVPEAKIAVVMNGNDYTMEGLIPTAALAKSDIPIKVASGAVLLWSNVIMFTDDGGAQGLASDAGWFSAEDCNAYTLVDTLAGIVPGGGDAVPSSGNNPFSRLTATADNTEYGTADGEGFSPTHSISETPDAAYDASKLFHLYWDTNPDTWAHGSVNTIGYLDPYGIGYGHERGTIYIENLDFGANGANKVTVSLTNTVDPFAGLGIYLDTNPVKDSGAQPLAVINDVLTDGFEDVNAQDYSVDVNIPGGVHTVYFMYLGMDVGSFFSVEFAEAPPPPAPEPEDEPAPAPSEPAAAAPAPTEPAATPAAPITGDISLIFAFAAFGAVILGFTAISKNKKRHENK